MQFAEQSLVLLAFILLFGLLSPALLRRFHLPFATTLVIAGAVLGPYGMQRIAMSEAIELIALIGASFQMLLAGLEAQKLTIRPHERETALLFALNGIAPGLIGFMGAAAVGLNLNNRALVALAFMSTSVPLVFSFVSHFKLGNSALGQKLAALAVLNEISSALIGFFLLKGARPHPRFSLPILSGLVFSSVFALRLFVPEILAFALSRFNRGDRPEQSKGELSLVLVAMLLALAFFTSLHVPAIIAAFLVGFALAPTERSDVLRERLHLVGHALFIPGFLFAMGMDTDWHIVAGGGPRSIWVAAFIAGAIVCKVVGGWLGGRLAGETPWDAAIVGVASSSRLAVPVALSYAALGARIISHELFSAVMCVSVVTMIGAPLALDVLLRRRAKS